MRAAHHAHSFTSKGGGDRPLSNRPSFQCPATQQALGKLKPDWTGVSLEFLFKIERDFRCKYQSLATCWSCADCQALEKSSIGMFASLTEIKIPLSHSLPLHALLNSFQPSIILVTEAHDFQVTLLYHALSMLP